MSLLELPVVSPDAPDVPEGVIPLTEGKACGNGCGTGGCGSSTDSRRTNLHQRNAPDPSVVIPFAERRLNLDAIPSHGMAITTIDMDLTVECNLRCTYCFKEKWTEHMEDQVAFDTVTWLIHSSGSADPHISFMGGEPLLRFKLIKKLVPFAKRRARQHGKNISISMTTNGTLVTDEVVEFWREWGLGFHTSIDGPPDIQDRNRPMVSGKGSSRLLEKAVPKILDYAPKTTARCTVTPESAGAVARSYQYFRGLGYHDIAARPGRTQPVERRVAAGV